jgi:hypothetical protein
LTGDGVAGVKYLSSLAFNRFEEAKALRRKSAAAGLFLPAKGEDKDLFSM